MRNDNLPSLPMLSGLKLVLGVCGGIAAYKSAELLRLLIKQGCEVQVVMTESATRFIAPLTFQALSGKPVHVSQWPSGAADRGMPHIDISRQADFMLIAPCTANSLAKYANGLADNLLDNLVLARNCPLAIAPAMNVEMWNNPATQRNLQQLDEDKVHVFGPASGEQACGETGQGRMLEPEELVFELAKAVSPQILKGTSVLLTAGPTFEAIDPVRGITNRSSGKMGYAIAQAAHLLGAKVTLISGPTALKAPHGVELVRTESAVEMHKAVFRLLDEQDVFIGVAAVADYGIKNASKHKQKKTPGSPAGLHMEFELNPDILADVGETAQHRDKPLRVIGFAAETRNLDEYAQAKLLKKKVHGIVGNLAQNTLNAEQVQLSLYTASAPPLRLITQPKLNAGLDLLNHLFKQRPNP